MDLISIKKEIEENKAILVDVREQIEWDESRLCLAILCSLSEIKKANFSSLPKDKKIYIHCKSGGRARLAKELLKDQYHVEAIAVSFEQLKDFGF